MTVSAAQVQDIQTTILSELSSGTWSLYGSQPTSYGENRIKFSKNVWIELYDSNSDIIYAMNNAPIYFDDTCELKIQTPNRTNLDKIYADVINIFTASSKNIIIQNPKDVPLRGKYTKTMTVKLLDI